MSNENYNNEKQEIVLFFSGVVDEKKLRLFLLKQLPKYMIPARFTKIAKFPYNDNGKIDRRSLREGIY